MRRAFRILRLIPLAFFCAAFALAALRVQAERGRDVKPLPGRLGHVQIEESFMQATLSEVSLMYNTILVGFFPGMVPPRVATQHKDPHGLDALKQRTKNPTLNF